MPSSSLLVVATTIFPTSRRASHPYPPCRSPSRAVPQEQPPPSATSLSPRAPSPWSSPTPSFGWARRGAPNQLVHSLESGMAGAAHPVAGIPCLAPSPSLIGETGERKKTRPGGPRIAPNPISQPQNPRSIQRKWRRISENTSSFREGVFHMHCGQKYAFPCRKGSLPEGIFCFLTHGPVGDENIHRLVPDLLHLITPQS